MVSRNSVKEPNLTYYGIIFFSLKVAKRACQSLPAMHQGDSLPFLPLILAGYPGCYLHPHCKYGKYPAFAPDFYGFPVPRGAPSGCNGFLLLLPLLLIYSLLHLSPHANPERDERDSRSSTGLLHKEISFDSFRLFMGLIIDFNANQRRKALINQ